MSSAKTESSNSRGKTVKKTLIPSQKGAGCRNYRIFYTFPYLPPGHPEARAEGHPIGRAGLLVKKAP